MASWFPSAHLPHSAASRRIQGANIRIALRSLLFQEVDQAHKRIKADYFQAVSHEIGKRVDVIKVKFAVTIIDDVLDAADFDVRFLHDALDLLNNFIRRRVALNLQTGFRRIKRARSTGQFLAAGGLTDVCRAEIKRFAREVNLDSVEKLAANNLHTNNMAAARGNEFLHQGSCIQPQIKGACLGRRLEFFPRIKLCNSGAATANVRLYHDREAQ